jgi:hypothetical protein
MKTTPISPLFWLFILSLSTAHAAVHINPDGSGQVLIFPYYTVNNNLNTVYTVTNTTPDTKAIKVRFLEGFNGLEVLEFNVYLDGYDSWSGSLIPTNSTIGSHTGEPSVLHVSADNSCSPFLITSGQEFLPWVIETDPPNTSMQRSREGVIEVIEMATFLDQGVTSLWADHGTSGVPINCAAIEADWNDNGVYDTEDERDVTGGLVGSVTLVNVAEGLSTAYRAIALDDFWTSDSGSHTEPGALLPNLAFGDVQSAVVIDNQVYEGQWTTGAESVTATLMSHRLINEYNIDPLNTSQTEWVISFPTKQYHTDVGSSGAIPPFSNIWDGSQSCEPFAPNIWDTDQQSDLTGNPSLCLMTNVIQFLQAGTTPPAQSALLGSNNSQTLFGLNSLSATDAGWAQISFEDPQQRSTPLLGDTLLGLPAVGIQVQQLTNAQAQPGLTAQYASSSAHRYIRTV